MQNVLSKKIFLLIQKFNLIATPCWFNFRVVPWIHNLKYFRFIQFSMSQIKLRYYCSYFSKTTKLSSQNMCKVNNKRVNPWKICSKLITMISKKVNMVFFLVNFEKCFPCLKRQQFCSCTLYYKTFVVPSEALKIYLFC